MTREEKYNTLKKIFWDYNVELLPLDKFIKMETDNIDEYVYNLVVTRILERLNWYDIIDILGIEQLKKILIPGIINRLRSNELKERYERIRRILFEEPLPLSGWDPEYIKRIKTTLLSNRWYAT
jgi:hypothetical protein